jgi:hypothetical protein
MGRELRWEIARRCDWLLVLILETNVLASSRSECRSIGPASMESSKASFLTMLTEALSVRTSRLESWARAATSIPSASRPITSPKTQTSSSVYRPAINKSVACQSARRRFSAAPGRRPPLVPAEMTLIQSLGQASKLPSAAPILARSKPKTSASSCKNRIGRQNNDQQARNPNLSAKSYSAKARFW